MDRRYRSLGMAGAIFVCLMAIHQVTAGPFSFKSGSKPASKGIQWHHDLKEAHKQAASAQKPLFIVFGAKWCTYCHKMERETLSETEMVKYIETHFIPVHLDYNKDREVADVLEVTNLPCTIVLNSEADLLGNVVGYVDSKELKLTLEQALKTEKQIQASAKQKTSSASKAPVQQVSNPATNRRSR